MLYDRQEIRAKELRIIDTDGTQLGIMSRDEAMELAESKSSLRFVKLILGIFHSRERCGVAEYLFRYRYFILQMAVTLLNSHH